MISTFGYKASWPMRWCRHFQKIFTCLVFIFMKICVYPGSLSWLALLSLQSLPGSRWRWLHRYTHRLRSAQPNSTFSIDRSPNLHWQRNNGRTFSLGPAPRPGRVMVLMCVSVCVHVCLPAPPPCCPHMKLEYWDTLDPKVPFDNTFLTLDNILLTLTLKYKRAECCLYAGLY